MLPFIYNEFVTALVFAGITTAILFIVMMSEGTKTHDTKNKSTSKIIKVFFVSLIIWFAVVYFMSSEPTHKNVMDHMIQGEPDF